MKNKKAITVYFPTHESGWMIPDDSGLEPYGLTAELLSSIRSKLSQDNESNITTLKNNKHKSEANSE